MVGQALMPSNRNIGSPSPLSVKVLRIWYASIRARMNMTSGTTMYQARALYKSVPVVVVVAWVNASCLAERRVRFDETIPSRISTKVNQRNSACQNRVAMKAQTAATMNSVIGTPRTQASRAS
ncbi:hypothetical protein D3C84_902520 [compost metagenome]